MTEPSSSRVSSLADLPSLFAAITASPDFQRAFGDPIPLSIIEPGEEPGEHDMPEPLAAQAECGGCDAMAAAWAASRKVGCITTSPFGGVRLVIRMSLRMRPTNQRNGG